MTEKCFDIGTMQAFLDGELDYKQSESVAEHLGVCDECAIQLAVAEEESSMAFSALDQEFNTLVPTQRLWTKINDSIEREKTSFWTPIFALFKQPSIVAFAGLIIVAGLFAIVVYRGTVEESQPVAELNQNKTIVNIPASKSTDEVSTPLPATEQSEFVAASNVNNNRTKARVIQVNSIKENRKSIVKSTRREIKKDLPEQTVNVNLTGEESYIKTIATLTETVNYRKDEVLKPSARFAFERDIAVADNAIKTMKAEVKQNPKDEAAKQILRASYQNKIDLLNSVADKTELMASVK